jgi:hypothetical protein
MPDDPERPPDADDPAERLAQFEQARGLEHDALIPGYDEGDEDAVADPDADDDDNHREGEQPSEPERYHVTGEDGDA